MKKIVTYSLLIITLFLFNYKAMSNGFNLLNHSAISSPDYDYDCGDKTFELQKLDEEDTSNESEEYVFFKKKIFLIFNNKRLLSPKIKILFISSDYSEIVYSPPEQQS